MPSVSVQVGTRIIARPAARDRALRRRGLTRFRLRRVVELVAAENERVRTPTTGVSQRGC